MSNPETKVAERTRHIVKVANDQQYKIFATVQALTTEGYFNHLYGLEEFCRFTKEYTGKIWENNNPKGYYAVAAIARRLLNASLKVHPISVDALFDGYAETQTFIETLANKGLVTLQYLFNGKQANILLNPFGVSTKLDKLPEAVEDWVDFQVLGLVLSHRKAAKLSQTTKRQLVETSTPGESLISPEHKTENTSLRREGMKQECSMRLQYNQALFEAVRHNLNSSILSQIFDEEEGFKTMARILIESGLFDARLEAEDRLIKYCRIHVGPSRIEHRGRFSPNQIALKNPFASKIMRNCLYISVRLTQDGWNTVYDYVAELHKKELKEFPLLTGTVRERRRKFGHIYLERLAQDYREGYIRLSTDMTEKEMADWAMAQSLANIEDGVDEFWHVPVEIDQNASCLVWAGILTNNYRLMRQTNAAKKLEEVGTMYDPYAPLKEFDGKYLKDFSVKYRDIWKIPAMQLEFGHKVWPSNPDGERENFVDIMYGPAVKKHRIKDQEVCIGYEQGDKEIRKEMQRAITWARHLPSTLYAQVTKKVCDLDLEADIVLKSLNVHGDRIHCVTKHHEVSDEENSHDPRWVLAKGYTLLRNQQGKFQIMEVANAPKYWRPIHDRMGTWCPTGLVHYLDSWACDYVLRKLYSKGYWALSIHDAFIVDPNAGPLVHKLMARALYIVHKLRFKILSEWFKNISRGKLDKYQHINKLNILAKNNPYSSEDILRGDTMK